jgi:hypothetical protein
MLAVVFVSAVCCNFWMRDEKPTARCHGRQSIDERRTTKPNTTDDERSCINQRDAEFRRTHARMVPRERLTNQHATTHRCVLCQFQSVQSFLLPFSFCEDVDADDGKYPATISPS